MDAPMFTCLETGLKTNCDDTYSNKLSGIDGVWYQTQGMKSGSVNIKKGPQLCYIIIPASASDIHTISSLSSSFCNLSSSSLLLILARSSLVAVGAMSELSIQYQSTVIGPTVAILHALGMGRRNGARWIVATVARQTIDLP